MSGYQVFTKVTIYPLLRGGTLIAWSLHTRFRVPGTYQFTVYASRNGVSDWTEVAQAVNEYIALDRNQWLYGAAPRLFYRVDLKTDDDREFVSSVTQLGGNMTDHDAKILRDIWRKERLRHYKFSGRYGWLYKRRYWGAPCTACTDYDTGEVKNASCVMCLGTGIIGGYFSPVTYWLAPSTPGTKRRIQTDDAASGVVEPRWTYQRGINSPWLDTGDVWVSQDGDSRMFVQAVQEITFRDVPIVFDPIELRPAPVTDIVFTLTRPDSDGGSSSSSEIGVPA